MSSTETIFADAFRAMAVWQGSSGTPEDRYISTFHFRVTDPGQSLGTVSDDIAEHLRSFYMDANGGDANQARPLTTYLSDTAIDFAAGLEVRVYDLREQEPRTVVPITVPVTGNVATSGLPNEVAVCLSYYGSRNIPRHRGRIYLGPLNANAMQTHEAGGDMGPHAGLVWGLRAAAGRLRAAASPALPWSVYSRVNNQLDPITAGWVDNSFDTQRRRGIKPSSRQTWPLP